MVNAYYDLMTDFYEWGWGECFHFAPRHSRESKDSSLSRHEHRLALALGLEPGMKVLDVGCGVGGPMREIARFSGATITGLNNNAYQIQRGKFHNARTGLDRLCDYLKADFMKMPVADNAYDAVYAIEATCHAPDPVGCYAEVLRVLKPGGMFAGYEWCMTDKYNPSNATHKQIKHEIEIGDGLPDIVATKSVAESLKKAGFEILKCEDVGIPSKTFDVTWYAEFAPSWSFQGIRLTWLGVTLTHALVWVLETIRLAPKGTTKAHSMLMQAAKGLLAGGQTGIFTPSYFFHARKPMK